MNNDYQQWAAQFAKQNGRQPTFQEYMAYKQSSQAAANNQPVNPDEIDPWIAQFEQLTGRQPTTAEYAAHCAAVTGTAQSEQPACPEESRQSAAPNQVPIDESVPMPGTVPPKQLRQRKPRHRGRRITLVIALLAVLLVGGIAGYGFFTERDEAKLGNLFDNAVKSKDSAALLRLFPADQTRSIFAKDGAKQIIKQRISFKNIIGKRVPGLSVTQRPYLFVFRNYYVSTQLTALSIPKQTTADTIAYNNKPITAAQLTQNPLFWGDYTFKVTRGKTRNGGKTAAAPVTITLGGGQKKRVTLEKSSDINANLATDSDDAPVKVTAKGWHTGVPKELQASYYRWSGYGTNTMEELTETAAGDSTGFGFGAGLGDGNEFERAAFQSIGKNFYNDTRSITLG